MKFSVYPRAGTRARSLKRSLIAALSISAMVVTLAGCASATPTPAKSGATGSFTPVPQKKNSEITVWVDSTRVPVVEQYQKAHPNVKMNIVTYKGGGDPLHQKIELYDRTGKGWPDVVFSQTFSDMAWATLPTKPSAIPFAAPLNKYVPKNTLDNFAKGSLVPCQLNGQVYCLRNDIAQVVLWYNKTLMDKFGYTVPTTWEEYQALGDKVAAQHPGYLIGSVGDVNSHDAYFWASQCPAFDLVKANTLRVDLQDPKCTRMAKLLDHLIANKTVSTDGFLSPDFTKVHSSKLLTAVAASWYGTAVFKPGYKTPAGQIAVAPPLKWQGDSATYTGDQGGGIWIVSSHSKNLKAAANLVTAVTTENTYQANAPTYPAYAPAATAWLANPAFKAYFANDIAPAFTQAAKEIWPGWATVRFSDATAWGSVVLPALTAGKTFMQTLPAWQAEISNEAKTTGYKVINQ